MSDKIREIRKRTDRPFGVDLLLPAKFAGSDRGGFDETELDARIPEPLSDFVAEVLHRRRSQRFQTAAEMGLEPGMECGGSLEEAWIHEDRISARSASGALPVDRARSPRP